MAASKSAASKGREASSRCCCLFRCPSLTSQVPNIEDVKLAEPPLDLSRVAHAISVLWSLISCGRAFEFGDQLQELGVMAETLQVVVGDQAICVFIPAMDGLL